MEIVFDNSDGRLSVESDEVVLRRTIGHKKDEFFVNRKRVQKAEIQSLLESAGFSKSNPYYIVQQGKVANLCLMKDTDRLSLLKDIAGTTVYEERRTESLKIMKDASLKQTRITEVLEFIDERMTELEKEKEELHEYDRLDKRRRALEFTLYDKEMAKATDQLQTIENTRDDQRNAKQEVHTQLQTVQDELQQQEDGLSALKTSLERLEERKRDKAKELLEKQERAREMQVSLQEAEASARARGSEVEQLQEELGKIDELSAAAQNQLGEVEPRFADLNSRRGQKETTLTRTKARVEQLIGKQGRGKQFTTKSERNAFLNEQISVLDKQVEGKKALISRAKLQMDEQAKRISKEQQAIASAELEAKKHSNTHENNNKAIRDAIVNRNNLQEQRKESWREMETVQESLNEAKQERERSKQHLNASLPKQVAVGLRVAEKIVQEKGITGYYGPLIDNFKLKSEAFRTAVEVAVGNALFHVVVDTDKTAATLIREMEKRKMGRLTFIPLNRIVNSHVTYPDSTDVRPMMEVALEYEPAFVEAIKHVFGRKLLARDLEVASQFSREFGLDAITREGDMVNRKGGFEGGYHDERVSRIVAAMKIRASDELIESLSEQERELGAKAENVEIAINEVVRELQRLESERDRSKSQLEVLGREIGPRKSSLESVMEALAARRRNLMGVEEEVAALEEKRQQFVAEKELPLRANLTSEEKEELARLSGEERVLQTQLDELEQEMGNVSVTRQKLRHDLQDNFNRRRAELEAQLTSAKLSMEDDDVAESSALLLERENISAVVRDLQAEVDGAEASILQKRVELSETQKRVEAKRLDEEKLVRSIDEAAKVHDKLMNRRTMLMETVQNKSRQIRDLGTLPREEAEEVRSLDEKQLLVKIAGVQEQLKKFPGVNRKALDQYVSFNEQRQSLLERKEATAKESDAIQKLVDSLDVQKEEAILRTFRGVSHHFSEVFSELVKDGKGQLIMRTSEDENEDEGGVELGEEEEEAAGEEKSSSKDKGKAAAAKASMSTFRGVQVRVSFSGSGQTFEMKQLSGGQKALVALALIFAIQRCDPAPFYLFDEIDQALDANYRTEVARLIAKQANDKENPTQFITTTFRPEMVEVAAKHYGIALVNKASNIYPLTKGDAQNFVSNMMLEEEKVGEVTSIARYEAGPTASAVPGVSGPEKEELDEDETRGQYGVAEESDDEEESAAAKQQAFDKAMGVYVEEGEGEGMAEEDEEDDLSEEEGPSASGSKGGAAASKKRKARVRTSALRA